MNRNKWHVALVVGVGLLIAGMIIGTQSTRQTISPPEQAVREVLAPVQQGVTWITHAIGSQFDRVRQLGRLEQENERLRIEVADLQQKIRLLHSLEQENEQLRAFAELSPRLPGRSLAAKVIGRNYNQWFSYVIINRGDRDGIKPGLPVFHQDGAVGQIETVTANTARVRLLTDVRSAVGGVVVGRNIPVLVEGSGDLTGKEAIVRPLVANSTREVGDVIVTSGLSAIFPAGIPIGVVTDIVLDPTGLRSRAVLALYVDFQHLDWLTVFFDSGVTIDPELFEDIDAQNVDMF